MNRNNRLKESSFESFGVLFDCTPVGLLVLDEDMRVIMVNDQGRKHLQTDEQSIQDSHIENVVPALQSALEMADVGRTTELKTETQTGTRLQVRVRAKKHGYVVAVWPLNTDRSYLTQQGVATPSKTGPIPFFNSVLRHDVLNGMLVIRSRAEMLRDVVTESSTDHVKAILNRCDDIIDTTENIQSIIKAATAPSQINLEPTSLDEAIEMAIHRGRSHADATIQVDVPDGLQVLANPLLDEVLGNVIENAVQHTGPEPSVQVCAHTDADKVRICIEDEGEGLPPAEDAATLLSETYPVDVGFGLYFVAVMVDAYEGDLYINQSDAGGTAVTIELPRA